MKTEKTQKNKINKRMEQINEITKKKTRRSKKIKNALINLKVFYQNIRGLKSKVDFIMETFSDYQPILIYLVETHLQKRRRNQDTSNQLGINQDQSIVIVNIKAKTARPITLEVLAQEQKLKLKRGRKKTI